MKKVKEPPMKEDGKGKKPHGKVDPKKGKMPMKGRKG